MRRSTWKAGWRSEGNTDYTDSVDADEAPVAGEISSFWCRFDHRGRQSRRVSGDLHRQCKTWDVDRSSCTTALS